MDKCNIQILEHSDVFVLSKCKNNLDHFKILKMYHILVSAKNGKC